MCRHSILDSYGQRDTGMNQLNKAILPTLYVCETIVQEGVMDIKVLTKSNTHA